jgi:hypothetical protein
MSETAKVAVGGLRGAVNEVVDRARKHFGLGSEGPDGKGLRIYPANPANSFDTGAMLDLRVRIAFDLLKSPMYEGVCLKAASMEELEKQPEVLARHALDTASALIALSEERDLVRPLPMDDPDSPLSKEDMERMTDQAGLMGAFQAASQNTATEIVQRFQREKQSGIAVPRAPGSPNAQ